MRTMRLTADKRRSPEICAGDTERSTRSARKFSICSPTSSPGAEVIETLRAAIARAGRLPRSADLLLCSLCAEYLLDELRGAGLAFVRPVPVKYGP
jgi:hypothetical protein